jgi:hypothetical protein
MGFDERHPLALGASLTRSPYAQKIRPGKTIIVDFR